MSLHFMLFFDRLILSKFSLTAMNASAAVGLLLFLFSFLGIGAAGIAEVFAGQYYGAKDYKNVARPIWQMIWLGIFLFIPFAMIGHTFDNLLVHESLGEGARDYFRFSMKIIFLSVVNTSLYAFYIARGRTFIATTNTVIGNIINAIMAYILVFGVKGYIEPQGLMGAAYATTIALAIQCLVLLIGFFSKENRDTFDTLNWKIDWKLFMNCIRIGLPSGIGNLFEIAGLAVIGRYATGLGHQYITIYTLSQNFLILFAFYNDGVSKAITAIASNAIGAKRPETIHSTLASAVKMQALVSLLIFFPLVIFPERTLGIFITNESDIYLIPLAVGALLGTWIYFILDGNTWVITSILTSGGDTKFVMFTNSIYSWAFMVAPFLLFINDTSHPSTAWVVIMPFYGATMLITYYIRFRMGRWKRKLV
jgi:MATE family multidrug resistance protein